MVTNISTRFSREKSVLTLGKNQTTPSNTAPQGTAQPDALMQETPVHPLLFKAQIRLTQPSIRFGAQTPLDALKTLAENDKPLDQLLKHSQSNATKAGSAKIDTQHLVLTILNISEKTIASSPEILRVPSENLNPVQLYSRTLIDSVLPPQVRNPLTPSQMVEVIRTAKSKVLSLMPPLTTDNTPAPLAMTENCQALWGEVISKSTNPGKDIIPQFTQYLKAAIPQMPAAPKEYQTISDALRNITKQAINLSKTAPTDVKEVEEPKIPLHERDKSTQGFLNRVKELRSKGVMTDYQYGAIQNLLHSEQGGGIFGGASQMDGGVTSKRLAKYLYEFDWKKSEAILDPERTRKILDEEHAHLQDVKDEIVSYVTRLQHLKQRGVQPKKSKILCLVGPPGVGKTSIALSIANSMNRKMGHISLSNIEKPSDLVGHSSTFVNAQPGRLFKALVDAGSINPVIVLDEVDKLKGNELYGKVADTLLPILDPKQNNRVVDEMLGPECPLDLSQTMFIVTANYEDKIPEALRDRMHMIRLDGYDVEEKIAIAKDHLIPRIRKDNSLTDQEFDVTNDALKALIGMYTREAGVRDLERNLENLSDTVIKKIANGETPSVIEPKDLEPMIGLPDIFAPESVRENQVGRVNGLAVVGSSGGMVMPITVTTEEIESDPEKPGRLRLAPNFPSGNLKVVIEESAKWAFQWVKTNKAKLGIELQKGKDIEVAIAPERGAMEKDGDSAGAAFTTSVVSALTGKPIRHDVAMTGTITLQGRVLAIGGVKQKLRGALTDKMKVVFLPKENRLDVEKLPEKMKADLNILTAEEFKEKVKTNQHLVEG
ncbi:MAG: AAA family ATPase, partial [Cyanobacteria bacterium]|nr:AAA family ATPase [Cyanobacteriota bacterium]